MNIVNFLSILAALFQQILVILAPDVATTIVGVRFFDTDTRGLHTILVADRLTTGIHPDFTVEFSNLKKNFNNGELEADNYYQKLNILTESRRPNEIGKVQVADAGADNKRFAIALSGDNDALKRVERYDKSKFVSMDEFAKAVNGAYGNDASDILFGSTVDDLYRITFRPGVRTPKVESLNSNLIANGVYSEVVKGALEIYDTQGANMARKSSAEVVEDIRNAYKAAFKRQRNGAYFMTASHRGIMLSRKNAPSLVTYDDPDIGKISFGVQRTKEQIRKEWDAMVYAESEAEAAAAGQANIVEGAKETKVEGELIAAAEAAEETAEKDQPSFSGAMAQAKLMEEEVELEREEEMESRLEAMGE